MKCRECSKPKKCPCGVHGWCGYLQEFFDLDLEDVDGCEGFESA